MKLPESLNQNPSSENNFGDSFLYTFLVANEEKTMQLPEYFDQNPISQNKTMQSQQLVNPSHEPNILTPQSSHYSGDGGSFVLMGLVAILLKYGPQAYRDIKNAKTKADRNKQEANAKTTIDIINALAKLLKDQNKKTR